MVNKKIQLDFTEEGLREKIEVVQGDTGRVLICNIIGVDMTNVSARFYAVKNSGKEIYNNCTVSQNTVTIELTEQTLAEVGIVKCQLDLRKGDQKVQSFIFDIDVTASLMAQSEYLSSSEYKVVDDLADKVEKNENKIAELDDKKANKDDYGSPLKAKTVAEMTDKKKVYVYVGTETGYINGNWYTWEETAWVSGGVYNSAAIQTDKTLTQSDKAADSAIVGQQIGELKESLNASNTEIERKAEVSLFTLGINETDELLYIYYNGEIVGDGVNIDGATGVRYNVTYDLADSVVSYNPKTIAEGKTFTTAITAKDGFNIVSVVVTMSSKDITETSYVHGVITIQEVTGPITITVKTKALPKDLDNTKILNIDLTGWKSKESILDSVTEKEYPIANKATKVFCNYYDSQKTAETKVTENGYTVAFVFDKTISHKAVFNSGIVNSYTKLVTGSYENFAALYSYGPFYNGTATKNVYFTDSTSVVKWHENWDNLPDINNLIVSYGNDGIVKWYLNGKMIYTFECDGWSSWNGANFFNMEGGVEISTDRCASMTRLTVYEGYINDTQAKQLSNFFLS